MRHIESYWIFCWVRSLCRDDGHAPPAPISHSSLKSWRSCGRESPSAAAPSGSRCRPRGTGPRGRPARVSASLGSPARDRRQQRHVDGSVVHIDIISDCWFFLSIRQTLSRMIGCHWIINVNGCWSNPIVFTVGRTINQGMLFLSEVNTRMVCLTSSMSSWGSRLRRETDAASPCSWR